MGLLAVVPMGDGAIILIRGRNRASPVLHFNASAKFSTLDPEGRHLIPGEIGILGWQLAGCQLGTWGFPRE